MLPSCKLVPSQAKNVWNPRMLLTGKLLAANAAETRKVPEKKLLDDLRPIIDEARVCFGDSTVAPSESLTEIIDSHGARIVFKIVYGQAARPHRCGALQKPYLTRGALPPIGEIMTLETFYPRWFLAACTARRSGFHSFCWHWARNSTCPCMEWLRRNIFCSIRRRS